MATLYHSTLTTLVVKLTLADLSTKVNLSTAVDFKKRKRQKKSIKAQDSLCQKKKNNQFTFYFILSFTINRQPFGYKSS